MSFLESWTFRSRTPAFDEGEILELYVSAVDPEDGNSVAYVGDTKLRITNGEPDLVDSKVRVELESFNDSEHNGKVTLLEVLSEPGF